MPSVSKAQQAIMGQAWALRQDEIKPNDIDPRYRKEIKKIAFGYKDGEGKFIAPMTDKELKKFAETKSKNLPERVNEGKSKVFINKIISKMVDGGLGISYNYKMREEIKQKIEAIVKETMEKYDYVVESKESVVSEDENPCWDGYKQIGMKTKNGKQVPNCVKESVVTETSLFTYKGPMGFTPKMYLGKGIKNIVPYLNPDAKKDKAGKRNLENLKDYRDWIKGSKEEK